MKCPQCGAEVTLGDKFCKQCGATLPEPEDPPKDTDPTAAKSMLKAKAEQGEDLTEETQLWEGRYSIKEGGGSWFALGLALIVVLIVYVFLFKDDTFLIIAAGLVALLFIISFTRYVVCHLTNKYRITNQRLFLIKGFLSRTTDEVELIRVDDVMVKQSLFERIFKIGTIVVDTPTDRSHEKIELIGVDEPEKVKEIIRKYARMRREKAALFVEQV